MSFKLDEPDYASSDPLEWECESTLIYARCFFGWLVSFEPYAIYAFAHLEPQPTSLKWMFGEPTISDVKIWNHPIETTIKQWLFRVLGRCYFFGVKQTRSNSPGGIGFRGHFQHHCPELQLQHCTMERKVMKNFTFGRFLKDGATKKRASGCLGYIAWLCGDCNKRLYTRITIKQHFFFRGSDHEKKGLSMMGENSHSATTC